METEIGIRFSLQTYLEVEIGVLILLHRVHGNGNRNSFFASNISGSRNRSSDFASNVLGSRNWNSFFTSNIPGNQNRSSDFDS